MAKNRCVCVPHMWAQCFNVWLRCFTGHARRCLSVADCVSPPGVCQFAQIVDGAGDYWRLAYMNEHFGQMGQLAKDDMERVFKRCQDKVGVPSCRAPLSLLQHTSGPARLFYRRSCLRASLSAVWETLSLRWA